MKDPAACRTCGYWGADIRINGCGCHVHAVSFRLSPYLRCFEALDDHHWIGGRETKLIPAMRCPFSAFQILW